MAVADPVAQAMSALHRIEASAGAATPEAAPAALNFVRQALALLQSLQVAHPAVDQGIEAIAGSLGVVHQLAQSVGSAPHAAPPPAVSPYAGTMMADQGAPHPQAPKPVAPAAAPARAAAPAAHAGAVAYAGNPAPAAAPAAAPRPAAVAPGGMQRFEAALGAHSPTNFYKGLSGNDVIESGGIFIATYQIPKIGTNIVVHVSLPGGYEFEAQAVVRWTREAPNSAGGGQEAPPGFGAQFLNISPEGRQLVYRYVRNREPLFHDDL
ncbi:MAG: PilZ domain-containing protein [Myxococcota bacterium]